MSSHASHFSILLFLVSLLIQLVYTDVAHKERLYSNKNMLKESRLASLRFQYLFFNLVKFVASLQEPAQIGSFKNKRCLSCGITYAYLFLSANSTAARKKGGRDWQM